jgi:alpha-tubulin suppressor-like RCC1 family protein
MGANDKGQLGMPNTNIHYAVPQPIVPSGVVFAAAGGGHSLFVKTDSSLWGMGDNEYGQLGDATFNTTNRPKQIVSGGVTAIAAGRYHSLFIKSDGSLWAMGNNGYGQLGDGTFSNTNRPKQIADGVVAVACGAFHSCFLKSDGTLWAMGWNYAGQVGDGTFNNAAAPQQLTQGDVVAVTAGYGHTLFIKSNGSLWAVGSDLDGQLGDGLTTSPSVTPEQVFPPPAPVLRITSSTPMVLEFAASCQFGATFYLLGTTDITQDVNLWTPLWTNTISSHDPDNFRCSLTNATSPGSTRLFYILKSQ